MKKIINLIIVFIFIAIPSFSQIPNSGFENWTSFGSYNNPDGWGTMNNSTAVASIYTATKGTPGSPGTSYLKLTSKTVGTGVVNGIAVSGILDSITMKPKSGFPCSIQPVSLTGKWQHMIYGSSQGSIKAVLTKWNTILNKRDTVALASQTLSGMAMSWANFTINFSYLNSEIPDSCIIELKASGSAPTNNDYLWVDNLAFSGTVTGIESEKYFISELSVFPNPTNEIVNVKLNIKTAQQISIEIFEINGKLIYSENLGILQGETFHSIELKNISNGNYIVRVKGEQVIETRILVIE